MKRVSFSVVIPAYNAVLYITDALNSVSEQRHRPEEVIVVNDGSEDGTSDIVRKYFASYQRIKGTLIDQENKKAAAARNAGIKTAKSDWLAFLDADDVWHAEKLEKVSEAINNNPHVDLVCHDEVFTSNGNILKENIYGPFENSLDILLKSCCLSTSAVCVKRSKLMDVGGFRESDEFFGAEDFDLWVRLAKVSKFFYLHEVLGEYRETKKSITRNIEQHSNNFWHVVKDHYYSLPGDLRKKLKYKYKRRCGEIFCGGGGRLLRNGNFLIAKEWYRKGLAEYPFYFKGWLGYICAMLKIRF